MEVSKLFKFLFEILRFLFYLRNGYGENVRDFNYKFFIKVKLLFFNIRFIRYIRRVKGEHNFFKCSL